MPKPKKPSGRPQAKEADPKNPTSEMTKPEFMDKVVDKAALSRRDAGKAVDP